MHGFLLHSAVLLGRANHVLCCSRGPDLQTTFVVTVSLADFSLALNIFRSRHGRACAPIIGADYCLACHLDATCWPGLHVALFAPSAQLLTFSRGAVPAAWVRVLTCVRLIC